MSTPASNLRDKWLAALLDRIAAGGGWTQTDMDAAAESAQLTPGEQALAAPHDVVMLIDHFFDQAATRTRTAFTEQDLSALKTEARMTQIVQLWLDQLAPHRDAVRYALYFGARPWNSGAALRRLWAVADLIWALTGDTSEDYNRYTKRSLLSAVLPSIVLFWLESPTKQKLEAHISQKLRTASNLGKSAGSLIKPAISRFRH